MAIGLGLSLTTGLLLFSSRAASAAHNNIFQLKMLLLIAAAAFHWTASRPTARLSAPSPARLRATGLAGLALWFSVALAGCAFIFLE